MSYFTPLQLITIVLLNVIGCHKQKPSPCGEVFCDSLAPVQLKFNLVKAGTDSDLVFGPSMLISKDSISYFTYPNDKRKASVDTVNGQYNFSIPYSGYIYLYIGLPGRQNVQTLRLLLKNQDCCHNEVGKADANDDRIPPFKQDSRGIFLIPVSR